MGPAAILAVLNLASAAVQWLRSRGPAAPGAALPELADIAVESLIDEALAADLSIEDARELFESGARAALVAVVGDVPAVGALAGLAADAGVRALRKRLSALAFARVARSLPELADAANRALGAFSAAPVVDVRPEDVRMEVVPWAEDGSATTEPASQGLPPLPPSGPSGSRFKP